MSDCFLFSQFYLQNKYSVVLIYRASSEKNTCRSVNLFFLAESSSSKKLGPRSSLPWWELLCHSFPMVHLCVEETAHCWNKPWAIALPHQHTRVQCRGCTAKDVAAKNTNITDIVSLILGAEASTVSLQITRKT